MFLLKGILLFLSLFRPSQTLNFKSDECNRELKVFDDALDNREKCAQKCKLMNFQATHFHWLRLFVVTVYDTWAKFPSGLLHGNLQTPDHFTECIKFRHESIQGQHCGLWSMKHQSRMAVSFGPERIIWALFTEFVYHRNVHKLKSCNILINFLLKLAWKQSKISLDIFILSSELFWQFCRQQLYLARAMKFLSWKIKVSRQFVLSIN